jgi:hypothetical protein
MGQDVGLRDKLFNQTLISSIGSQFVVFHFAKGIPPLWIK